MIYYPCVWWIWAKILFIGEWLPGWKCMAWTWYIDNDMVFFIFLPFFVLLYFKSWKIAYISYFILILASIAYTFGITMIEDLGASMTNDLGNINTYIYWRPWGRFGVYVVGVIAGCMYFEYWNLKKHPELSNSLGVKFFELVNDSKITWHSLFVVGWALLTYMIFWNLKEI